MSENKVLIGYVHGPMLHTDFVHSLLRTIIHDLGTDRHLTAPGGWVNNFSGPNVSNARNEIANYFLTEHTAEWLLMLDTDIVFPPFLVHYMVEQANALGATMLSGVYWGMRNNPDGGIVTFPLVYISPSHTDGRQGYTREDTDLTTITGLPASTDPFLAGGVGAGCLLVHRTVFQDIRDAHFSDVYPWFQEVERNGAMLSEDLEFCLRAAEAGHPVWVDPRLEVGHVKMLPLHRELMSTPLMPPTTTARPPHSKSKHKRR